MFLLLSWSFLIPLYFHYISFLSYPLLSVHFFHPRPSRPLHCLALFPLLLLFSPCIVTLLSFSPLPISLLPSASSSPLSHPLLFCPPCPPFISPFYSTLVLSSLSLSLPFLSSPSPPMSSFLFFSVLSSPHFCSLTLVPLVLSLPFFSPFSCSFQTLSSLFYLYAPVSSPLLTSTFLSFSSSWLITFPSFPHSSSFCLLSCRLSSSLPFSSDCPLLISSF